MNYSPLQYSLNLLKMRDRSEGEIREKLSTKGFTEEVIKETISFLKEKDFLNDERFVRNFIRSKQQFRSAGKYKIKLKLQQLHINKELVDRELGKISSENEKERALELACNWLNKKHSVLPERRYEKLGRYLVGQGYDIGVVKEVLNLVLKNKSEY